MPKNRVEDYDTRAVQAALRQAREIVEVLDSCPRTEETTEKLTDIRRCVLSLHEIAQRHGYVTTHQLDALTNWERVVRAIKRDSHERVDPKPESA